ncbi:MAG: nucleotidyltransferase family protein [Armatimonadota bacterium]
MSRLEQLRTKREDILRLADRRGVHNLRVFGSVARGEATDTSDVDLLVDVDPGRSLLDLGGLLMELQELLGCEVDLVPAESLKERMVADAIPL